ncbi:MAG: hypothetical protein QGM50_01475 [Anaerolineae bacterium]|nr:hypothetical protein [Anaerolineae bacterium]MDK1080563.1 hypothetical protein [Anaerolineae bacterium]MDK1117438.1 hypothetical protein [Anaerolineae bacterium]
MKFSDLITQVSDQPLFETGLLLTGDVNPNDVRRQLSRWVKAGRIQQLKRGVYTLAAPYQKVTPHPFLVANTLVTGSYVSGQSALAFYGLIPEYVPITLSVTTLSPTQWQDKYFFRHLAAHLFFGYQSVDLPHEQRAFVATPEKALLDLAHLTPKSDSQDYLIQLRLKNLETFDLGRLNKFVQRAGKPKWLRVARLIEKLVLQEQETYEEIM